MTDNNQQVPWTDEQWARVRKVITEEADRARVAASFLPLTGPLPANTDYVPVDRIYYSGERGKEVLQIEDKTTIELATLQVKVFLRGAQMADPDMDSALQLFRKAANVLARLEDSVVFNGIRKEGELPQKVPKGAEILGGQKTMGLVQANLRNYYPVPLPPKEEKTQGQDGSTGAPASALEAADRRLGSRLVHATSKCIGDLEAAGHFGPFALVLDQDFFTEVQTPNGSSLVLPQDRIIPFLGGGPLLRSSALPSYSGVIVALGAAPLDLVIATDVSLNFLQVTPQPTFVFRVYEKIVLRIKEEDAIQVMLQEGTPQADDAQKVKQKAQEDRSASQGRS